MGYEAQSRFDRHSFLDRYVSSASVARAAAGITIDHLEKAQAIHSSRDNRLTFFSPTMFGEPAWDMLLGLYIAKGAGYRMKVTDACVAARCPSTTAMRWLDYLVKNGLAVRIENDADRRSSYVEISSEAVTSMSSYLDHL